MSDYTRPRRGRPPGGNMAKYARLAYRRLQDELRGGDYFAVQEAHDEFERAWSHLSVAQQIELNEELFT